MSCRGFRIGTPFAGRTDLGRYASHHCSGGNATHGSRAVLRETDQSGLRADDEELRGKRQTRHAPCVAQVPELADANEATWQDVMDKAAEKLMRREGHFALFPAMRVVLPKESTFWPSKGSRRWLLIATRWVYR